MPRYKSRVCSLPHPASGQWMTPCKVKFHLWRSPMEVSIAHSVLNNLELIFLCWWFKTLQHCAGFYFCSDPLSGALCLQHRLFISPSYKPRSDTWAQANAPSIFRLNMCQPDQVGVWRARWRMLQIGSSGPMNQPVLPPREFRASFACCALLVDYAVMLINGPCRVSGRTCPHIMSLIGSTVWNIDRDFYYTNYSSAEIVLCYSNDSFTVRPVGSSSAEFFRFLRSTHI